MTRPLAILSLLVLVGCASQPKSHRVAAVPSAIMPPKVVMRSVVAHSVAIVQTNFITPNFDYSKSTTNTIWWLDASSDLVNWSAVAGPYRGLPDGRTDEVAKADKMFYRMRGYEP